MRTRSSVPVAVALVAALALTGCGGSSGDASESTAAVDVSTGTPTGGDTDTTGPATSGPSSTSAEPTATDPATTDPAATEPATSATADGEPATGDVPVAGDAPLAADLVDELATVAAGAPPTAFGIATIDGSDTRVAVAGTVSVDDPTPVDLDARFHLGSDTKAMTAVTLASVLAEHGLTLSSTLAEVLSGVTPPVALDPAFADVTVAQLLGHRSGIVDEELTVDEVALAAMPSVEGRDAGVRQVLAAPPQDPTRAFSYSNAGFAAAGWIAEQLTGEAWEDLIRERVFEPLGMTCGFGAPDGADEPIGHDETGAADGRVDTVPELLGPAGRVACSMADWARWARAALDLAMGRPSELLPAPMAAELFEVVDGGDYVSGWAVLPGADAGVVYTHDGSNLHWLARIVLVPSLDRALLIAANAADGTTSAAFDGLVGRVFSE